MEAKEIADKILFEPVSRKKQDYVDMIEQYASYNKRELVKDIPYVIELLESELDNAKTASEDKSEEFKDEYSFRVLQLEKTLKHLQTSEQSKCDWRYDENHGCYHTICGNSHVFINDSIKENNYKFCPYCGKEIALMTDKELKKKAFLEKASINKKNFSLHLGLVKKHLCFGDKPYIDDLKSFYERQVVGDALLLQLMDYAEEYADNRAVANER